MDLDQKNPGILPGGRSQGTLGPALPKNLPRFGGNRKVWKHSWDFLEFIPSFEIPGWIFLLFCLLGWGNFGILGFLELDFQENGGASMDLGWENLDLGKARGGFGSGRNFWGSFPFFSTLSSTFGDFIHEKIRIEIFGNNSCLNPIFSQFFFPNSCFLAPFIFSEMKLRKARIPLDLYPNFASLRDTPQNVRKIQDFWRNFGNIPLPFKLLHPSSSCCFFQLLFPLLPGKKKISQIPGIAEPWEKPQNSEIPLIFPIKTTGLFGELFPPLSPV